MPMAIKDIILLPDPVLRDVSQPFETITPEALALADDMLETMYDAPGIGLAAIQIAVPKRLVVVDVSDADGDDADDDVDPRTQGSRPVGIEDTRNPIVMFNPEILERKGRPTPYEEGCLSIPEVLVEIERPSIVTVRYVDRQGVQQELTADGLLAKAIQHEVDHLDGKLIVDFLSRLKRDIIVRRFRKQARDRLA